jgi:predicted phage tail protein
VLGFCCLSIGQCQCRNQRIIHTTTDKTWNGSNVNISGNARVEHRQANINEATILDKARARINREGTTSEAEKAQALRNLDALACAEIQCAAGVSANDPNFEKVADLQAEGEKLKAETGEDIFSTLDDLDILSSVSKEQTIITNEFLYTTEKVVTEEEQFQYGAGDVINDGIDSNEKAIAKVGGVLQTTAGLAGTVSGAVLTATGAVACPTGIGCLAAAGGVALTGLGVAETVEGIQKVAGEHEYEGGQRVFDSLSAETHQGEHNAVAYLATDTAIAAATGVAAKVGLNKAGDLYDAVKEKLPSGNNGSASGDGEVVGQDGPTYDAIVHGSRSADELNAGLVKNDNEKAWVPGDDVNQKTLMPGKRIEMIVTDGQLQAIKDGKSAIGGWASQDKLPNNIQDARDVTGVKKQWKNDDIENLHVITLEVKEPIKGNSGIANTMYDEMLDRELPGKVNQFQFENTKEAFDKMDLVSDMALEE